MLSMSLQQCLDDTNMADFYSKLEKKNNEFLVFGQSASVIKTQCNKI